MPLAVIAELDAAFTAAIVEHVKTQTETIAAQICWELDHERYDVLAYLRRCQAEADRSADRVNKADRVYIEEGVSAALENIGINSQALYMRTVGLVFGWLQDAYGIEPPTWYVNREPNGPEGGA